MLVEQCVLLPSSGANVGVVAAVIAGLLSFLSPCVLPLVPSYVAFLTGVGGASVAVAGDDDNATRAASARTLLTGILFVCGFSTVFILLGASASVIGGALHDHSLLISRIGGALLIALGLVLIGLVRIPGLHRDLRVLHLVARSRTVSYLGAYIVGFAFGAGWTPCIGPVLAGILTLAAARGTVGDGMLLLAAYSAGLAIPFLLATVALDRFVVASRAFRRWLPWVNRVSGVLMIALGLLMSTGTLSRLSAVAARYTPTWMS